MSTQQRPNFSTSRSSQTSSRVEPAAKNIIYVATGDDATGTEKMPIVHIWDGETGKLLNSIKARNTDSQEEIGHGIKKTISQLAFSKDGKTLCVLGKDTHYLLSSFSTKYDWTSYIQNAKIKISCQTPTFFTSLDNYIFYCGGNKFFFYFSPQSKPINGIFSPGRERCFTCGVILNGYLFAGSKEGTICKISKETIILEEIVNDTEIISLNKSNNSLITVDSFGLVKFLNDKLMILQKLDLFESVELNKSGILNCKLYSDRIHNMAANQLNSNNLIFSLNHNEQLLININRKYEIKNVHVRHVSFSKMNIIGISFDSLRRNILHLAVEEGHLLEWNIETCELIRYIEFPEKVICMSASSDNFYIAISFESETSNYVNVHLKSDFSVVTRITNKRNSRCTALKYSVKSDLLCLGYECGIVKLYETEDYRKKKNIPKVTINKITNIDFSLYYVDESTEYEYYYLKITSIEEEKTVTKKTISATTQRSSRISSKSTSVQNTAAKPKNIYSYYVFDTLYKEVLFSDKDITWFDYTSVIGNYIKGLKNITESIKIIEYNHEKELFIVGLNNGLVRIYQYPIVSKYQKYSECRCHYQSIKCMLFIDNETILTYGGKDEQLIIWSK